MFVSMMGLRQYMELLVRYAKFFTVNTDAIPRALQQFVAAQGLRHPKPVIRARCAHVTRGILH